MTRWKEAETTTEPSGKPTLHLYGKAAEQARALGAARTFISASDTAQHAVAIVILEGRLARPLTAKSRAHEML